MHVDWQLDNCHPRNTDEPGHKVARCVPSVFKQTDLSPLWYNLMEES